MTIQFEFLMRVAADVGELMSMGGGSFEGPQMKGSIVPGGTDWQTVPPQKYFFRTVMRFETGDAGLQWLNRTIAVATAQRKAHQVLLTAHRLL